MTIEVKENDYSVPSLADILTKISALNNKDKTDCVLAGLSKAMPKLES